MSFLRVSLRPLATSTTAAFKASAAPNTRRLFSSGFSQFAKQNFRPKVSTPLFFNGSRNLSTNTMVQQQSFSWQRLAITAAGVAGTVVVLDAVINRESRDSLSDGERSLLNDSFMYTGGGLALAAITARSLFRSGATYRMMAMNPWAVLGVSLVGSIGTMMGAIYTSPENTVQKHLFWLAFNGFQAATLSPLFFYNPALLGRAALYTLGTVGAISYVGATAKNDKYLYLGGPLLAGITVVALSSLAPMVIPTTAVRSLAIMENISLYGGLAVFGGFVLFDTQKILQHGRLAEQGLMKPDPIKESISLELDMINIFIRLVTILGMRSDKRK